MLSCSEWLLKEEKINKSELTWREALFALSTGSMGVRGVLEERPCAFMGGTYLGGVFNTGESWSNDMVNLPDFSGLYLYIDGELLSIDETEVVSHERILDMRQAVLYRNTKFKTKTGKIITWQSERFVSMDKLILCAERHSITPENFSGTIQIVSKIDADTKTHDSFGAQKVRHYKTKKLFAKDDVMASVVSLTNSKRQIATASKIVLDGKISYAVLEKQIAATTEAALIEGTPFELTKYSATASDIQFSENRIDNTIALVEASSEEGFLDLLSAHTEIMNRLWEDADFVIEGDAEMQKKIRYNIFVMICAGPRNNPWASIGARGLTGERYRGHIYWDTEAFMLAFYTLTDPKTAKDILTYRYNLLDGARRNAIMSYYKGARFPYQSADTGDEASPVFGLNGKNDLEAFAKNPLYHFVLSNQEVQITASVMFGVYEYYKLTDDREFMQDCGLEMFLETARFWLSRMEWVEENGRHEILDVIGPDEFHEDVNNNPYTNYMAWFNIKRAVELYEEYSKTNKSEVERLKNKIAFCDSEIAEFNKRLKTLYLPQPNEDGIIEQFEGYYKLADYSKGAMNPIDLINLDFTGKPIPNALGGELKTYADRQKTRVIKQCDTILMFCMLPDLFDPDIIAKNYDYYEPRTMHASSLSPNTASIMGLRTGRDAYSYSLLDLSASIDIYNVQLNSHHGLHLASVGGTWMNALYGYGGIYLTKDFDLEIRPNLPKEWKSLAYRIRIRGSKLAVYFNGKCLRLNLIEGSPITLKIKGKDVTIDKQISIDW